MHTHTHTHRATYPNARRTEYSIAWRMAPMQTLQDKVNPKLQNPASHGSSLNPQSLDPDERNEQKPECAHSIANECHTVKFARCLARLTAQNASAYEWLCVHTEVQPLCRSGT
eukprot:3432703-Amphidinium_carterae.1